MSTQLARGVNTTAQSSAVLSKAAHNAARIEHNNQTASAQKSSSGFDVWKHTGKGLLREVSFTEGVMQGTPVGGVVGAYRGLSSDWSSNDSAKFAPAVAAMTDMISQQAGDISKAEGVLPTIGATFSMLTSVEQMISMPLSAIPFPALPAVRIMDMDIGLPHAHNHPPNLTPPNPVPVPLPSTGPVIPIPFLSGANKTLINSMPAARCGDMGLGIWCGGYFPMYEIFLGSSNVWIEGARAARMGVDITKHCVFSSPKPNDPPLGPMIGTTIQGSPNVVIGGVPMPSLLNMAMGTAMKGIFAGTGKLARKFRANKIAKEAGESVSDNFSRRMARNSDEVPQAPRRGGDEVTQVYRRASKDTIDYVGNYVGASKLIDIMEHHTVSLIILGDEAFVKAVRSQLRQVACSKIGREVLEDIMQSKRKVVIEHLDDAPAELQGYGPHCARDKYPDASNGTGSDSTIRYDPHEKLEGSPPDTTLMHELGHARTGANGTDKAGNTTGMKPETKAQWRDWEEVEVIDGVDNPYRKERGLPLLSGHDHLPGTGSEPIRTVPNQLGLSEPTRF